MPGGMLSATCPFATEAGVMPRYGRAYDLRNVDNNGNDDNEGSFDSYTKNKYASMSVSSGKQTY